MKTGTEHSYTVKESPRARHARLNLSLRRGLVVVVPKGFDHSRIPGLIAKKKRWLEKAREKIDIQRRFFEPEPPGLLPERLNLKSIGEVWAIDYRSTEQRFVTAVERPGMRLLVFGATDNIDACKNALRRWLNRKTHAHLETWLLRLASENGFSLHRVLVKSQKTRWASCSRHNTVSINLKLLFVPEELVRYVLIHELCHIVHLDHSRRFWELLRHYDPYFIRKDERLRSAWRNVPAWLDAGKMCGRL